MARIKPKLRLLLAAIPFVAFIIVGVLLKNRFWSGLLIGISLAPILIFGLLTAFGLFMRRKIGTTLKPPPMPANSWNYELDATDLNGERLDPAAWRGKVVVMNYWATWCAPCAAEMPNMMRLMEKTADTDIQFAFITKEDAATVQPFVAKRAWSLPFLLQQGETPKCFEGRGIPATFIIDKSGTIVLRHFGAAAWDADHIVSFVRGLTLLQHPR